jgi:hypothetical protein
LAGVIAREGAGSFPPEVNSAEKSVQTVTPTLVVQLSASRSSGMSTSVPLMLIVNF